MCLCLYGNDIDETKTPLEAGLAWTVKFEKDRFIGKEALLKQKEAGLRKRLVAMESDVGRVPRKGCEILLDGEPVGLVTSGGYSPSLQKPVSMGYVDVAHARRGTELKIDVSGTLVGATIVKKPLYREGSHK
jgi:aminomethyltransferase